MPILDRVVCDGGSLMNLNAPSQVVFWIAVVLAVLAIIGFFAPTVPILGAYAFWIAILAYGS